MATVTATHASANGAKLDPADPNVRKIVYNVYRNMLGTYNDKANGIIDQKPRELVREDKGITRQLESMILQSNQIGGGPPPPPPPPPLSAGPGYIPGARLNTEIGPREPPATIQNAMMSKDKKPFTYTPGGLDLSQIRSPRMQKRISRNAQAEGVPPQPAQAPGGPRPAPGPLPPSALAAMQTQLPVAVFPTGAPAPPPPPPPPANFPSQTKQYSPPPPAPPFIPENYFSPPPPTPQPLQVSSPTSPGSGTGSLYVPPVQTSRAQLGSLYIPPVQQQQTPSPPAPPQPSPPSASTSTTSPSSAGTPVLNKTTPAWLSGQREQEQRKPQNLPPWVREEQEQQQFEQNQKPTNRQPIQQQQIPITRPPPQQQQIPITRPPPQQQQIPITTSSGANAATRIIPIQIEGRDPPPNINQQQQFQSAPQRVQQPQQQQQQTRIIPIQIEGQQPVTTSNGQRKPGNTQNKFNQPTTPGAGQIRSPPVSPPTPQYCESPQEGVQSPRQLQTQQSWSGNNGGPVQSRSFRVLQRMTDTIDGQENNTDPSQAQQWGPQNTQGVPVNQLRKMQLTDDDRALMNKFKAQVDGEGGSLHTEEDPRYRGAAIPSRAFRALQTMTGETNDPVPRGPLPGPHNKPTVASTVENVPQGAYVPPSEQTAPEPRKYTGGAIPSRSFRMLQAMTAPENCGPGQSDM